MSRPYGHSTARDRSGKPGESDGGKEFARKPGSASIPSHAARREGPNEGQGGFLAQVLSQAAPYMGASWVLTAGLLIGSLGGRWLDQKLGTEPWLMVAGLLAGLVVGMWEVARVALRRGGGQGS
jgi:ATP synthase protein I